MLTNDNLAFILCQCLNDLGIPGGIMKSGLSYYLKIINLHKDKGTYYAY